MDILRPSLLGGLLGLDATSVGQFMASRPLVGGVLAGALLGNPVLGVSIGAVLELYLLVSFPTGGARFPEGSTATVVAVASATPFDGVGALPIAVGIGLIWGQIGGVTISAQRHVNSRLVPEHADATHRGGRVAAIHAAAILIDFVRATLVTASGIAIGRVTLGALVSGWPLSATASMGLLLVGGAVSGGILLHDVGGFRRRRIWFAAGIALGIVGTRFL